MHKREEKSVICEDGNRILLNIGDKFKVVKDCCCAYSVHIFDPIVIKSGAEITCKSITHNLYGIFICGDYKGKNVEIDPSNLILLKD